MYNIITWHLQIGDSVIISIRTRQKIFDLRIFYTHTLDNLSQIMKHIFIYTTYYLLVTFDLYFDIRRDFDVCFLGFFPRKYI